MPLDVLIVIRNFVVVCTAIVLFMSPFYLLFRYKHRGEKHLQSSFNYSLEQFFTSPQANWLVFFWAAGEATVWFVIPEFLLLLVIFMRVHKKFELVLYDIYGTVAGTLIAFAINFSPSSIAKLPFVYPNMTQHVERWYHEHGVFGLLYQPFSGVPYKVFTFSAPDYHFFIPFFLFVAVSVRIARYFISFEILSALFPVLHKYVYRNYIPLFLGAVFFFSLMLLKISSAYH